MSSDNNTATQPLHLTLGGVDHTARPTWKLRETIEFYRDKLGLPLIHVISARGWGPATHPDFLHFFFDSGNGSTIAFFYYLGSDQPATLDGREHLAPVPEDHVFDATHTAWQVETAEDLHAWKLRLESKGLNVSSETRHEVIESIYVRDPNGYFIEFTRKLRALNAIDATDGDLTLQAALNAEATAHAEGRRVTHIDEVWAVKADLLDTASGGGGDGLSIYVPCVDEFATLVHAASLSKDCTVTRVGGYDRIDADRAVEFRRADLGLKPAVWYGLFTGGLRGTIETLDRDRVRIAPPRAAA
jgi:catechol 2,3-dioxygenase-like lactoylglutathione lyase family enzyme